MARSEDAFAELREWIVLQGKHYYDDISQHPERLCSISDAIDYDVFEQIDLVLEAYHSRTDEPLPAIEHSLLEPDS